MSPTRSLIAAMCGVSFAWFLCFVFVLKGSCDMKKWLNLAAVAAASLGLIAPATAADWGHLSGKFVYDGTAPKPKPLTINKDNQVCDQFKDEVVEQQLLVGEQNGLSNVFVYLRVPTGKTVDAHPDYKKAAENPAVIENFHCMFYPHAVGVWAKQQKVLVKNRDPLPQVVKVDVFANTPINLTMGIGGEVEHNFPKGEKLPAQVTCGIHPWESAWLLVSETPYFAVTDKNGEFTIKNIPAGEWEFQVWQEKAGYLIAKPDWKQGRFKQVIKAGDNSIGTLKIAPAMFEKAKK